MDNGNRQVGMELCQVISMFQFVGVNQFWDIMFPSNAALNTHDSELCSHI